MKPSPRSWGFLLRFAAIMLIGAYARTSGLFRGLRDEVVFHPDTPKQVMMLSSYLQGQYVRYQDNLFYDGYPYGLNRVDEILIRPAYALQRTLSAHGSPEARLPPVPERRTLYYWARTLRALYGLMTILLLYGAARRLGMARGPSLGGALLLALAPLAATVTHSASGDVGVDLFLVLALWCMARYAATAGLRWITAGAAACGMAYACKYQGGLGLWLIGLPPLLLWARARERFRSVAWKGWLALAGFAAGVLALTPAFFINASRTWKDMRANVEFIRNYGVPDEFLARPLGERITHGWSRNVPFIAESLGWALSLITLLALAMLWRHARRGARRPDDGPTDVPDDAEDARSTRRHAVLFTAVAFPIVALIFSTSFKPAVQPFHFSYLLPFMALAAAVLLDRSAIRVSAARRPVILLLVTLAAMESVATGRREDFFWRRGETLAAARQFADGVFENPPPVSSRYDHERALKHFFAEPSRLPVFRNRPHGLHHPGMAWWHENDPLPLPAVPLPTTSEWIFMNGPVFPRSDRLFRVPAEERAWTRRTIVFETKPETLRIGLRTGRFPARYTIVCSGRSVQGVLPPQSQTLLTLDNVRPVHSSSSAARSAFPVPLRVRTSLGPLWITLIENEREEAVFESFGPTPPDAPVPSPIQHHAEALETHMQALRYLDGTERRIEPGPPAILTPTSVPLPAGPYRLEMAVANPSPSTATLTLALADPSGLPGNDLRHTLPVPPGHHAISWNFRKNFAPYDASVSLQTDHELRVPSWQIKPDIPQLADWWQNASSAPTAQPTALDESSPPLVFPNLGVWRGLHIRGTLQPGEPFEYAVRFDLDPGIPHDTFHHTVIFLHLFDPDGQRLATFDYPLRKAALTPDWIPWQQGQWPIDLSPEAFRIDGGLYNIHTRKRFGMVRDRSISMDRRRRFFQVVPRNVERTD